MKKMIMFWVFLAISLSMFGTWEVGDIITDDYDWTDSNGEYHSIHELTAAGKVVYIFWGESW